MIDVGINKHEKKPVVVDLIHACVKLVPTCSTSLSINIIIINKEREQDHILFFFFLNPQAQLELKLRSSSCPDLLHTL